MDWRLLNVFYCCLLPVACALKLLETHAPPWLCVVCVVRSCSHVPTVILVHSFYDGEDIFLKLVPRSEQGAGVTNMFELRLTTPHTKHKRQTKRASSLASSRAATGDRQPHQQVASKQAKSEPNIQHVIVHPIFLFHGECNFDSCW